MDDGGGGGGGSGSGGGVGGIVGGWREGKSVEKIRRRAGAYAGGPCAWFRARASVNGTSRDDCRRTIDGRTDSRARRGRARLVFAGTTAAASKPPSREPSNDEAPSPCPSGARTRSLRRAAYASGATAERGWMVIIMTTTTFRRPLKWVLVFFPTFRNGTTRTVVVVRTEKPKRQNARLPVSMRRERARNSG